MLNTHQLENVNGFMIVILSFQVWKTQSAYNLFDQRLPLSRPMHSFCLITGNSIGFWLIRRCLYTFRLCQSRHWLWLHFLCAHVVINIIKAGDKSVTWNFAFSSKPVEYFMTTKGFSLFTKATLFATKINRKYMRR